MNFTPENIAAIYDFPGIFEPALKCLFTARQVKAFTSQAVPSTGIDEQDDELRKEGYEIILLQRDRPRVEISFGPGAGQEQFRILVIDDEGTEVPVETSWTGQFRLDVVTIADVRIHRAFVTMVRFVMHTQLLTLNGAALTKHKIQSYQKDSGTTPIMEAEKGAFQSTLLTDIQFSIQDDAWEIFN